MLFGVNQAAKAAGGMWSPSDFVTSGLRVHPIGPPLQASRVRPRAGCVERQG